jgi:hypothetical protein
MSNVDGLSRYAQRPRSSIVVVENDEDQAGDDLTFAKKLAIANPDLSAELEILQKEIRPRSPRLGDDLEVGSSDYHGFTHNPGVECVLTRC